MSAHMQAMVVRLKLPNFTGDARPRTLYDLGALTKLSPSMPPHKSKSEES